MLSKQFSKCCKRLLRPANARRSILCSPSAGSSGGLVGSTILTFCLHLVCKEFGSFENWARIVMPGTALGVLLELFAEDDKFALHVGSLLPLFLAWQMTVAAIIGYCIVPRSGDGKLAPH